jgi:8-oxo-dGDP phosphatase
LTPVTQEDHRTPRLWRVRERTIDESRQLRLSIAEVQLPDGVTYQQYVMRLPRAAVAVVVNDHDEVLMLHRHRFIIGRWVWELPGGYVEDGESAAVAAVREVEEETGWRPGSVEPLASLQPMVGLADAENELFLVRGATYAGPPNDINEADQVAWIPVEEAFDLIASGQIVGAASIVGLLYLREITKASAPGMRSAHPGRDGTP